MIENFWQIMLFIGLVLIALEAFAPGFILLPVGIAFVLSSGMSFFLETWTQVLAVLSLNTLLVFLVFYKFVKPRFNRDLYKTNADSMIGKEVKVLKEIKSKTEAGVVRLYGDEWRALPVDNTPIPVGESVVIAAIEGNKVIVEKISDETFEKGN